MREILFRGKRVDNGEWVYGYYAHLPSAAGAADIIYVPASDPDDSNHTVFVDPETIGQFTGLTDKNGVKIFEGDIVRFKHDGDFGEKIYYRNYAVEFINTYVTYGLRLRNRSIHFPFKQGTASQHDAEVIGNIYDNPELIEDGET